MHMENPVQNSLIQDPTLQQTFEKNMRSRNHWINSDPFNNQMNPLHSPASAPLEFPAEVLPHEFMDEDLRDQDLRELDIGSMEDACTWKAFDSIPAQKTQLFQEDLVKSKAQNKLGAYHPLQKDKPKMSNDNRKRGRKIDLQQLNRLDNELIESGKYAYLMKFFSSSSQGIPWSSSPRTSATSTITPST